MRAPLLGLLVPSLLLGAGLAACGGPEFVAPSDEGGVELVTIRGQVIDSLTRAPVAGVSVGVEGKFFHTDPQGYFTGSAASGLNDIHVAAASFEPIFVRVNVDPQNEFVVQLRRLAPLPLGCEIGPTGFAAFVIDLQGRKSIERWSQSSLTLVTETSRRTIGAIDWDYLPLDTYRWQVMIPDADPALTRVEWSLYDSEGHTYRGSCEPLSVAPPDPERT